MNEIRELIMLIRHKAKRWQALDELLIIGEPVVETLLKDLTSEIKEEREWAAWTLGRIGNIHAVKPLLEKLDNDEETVQLNVVQSLGLLGDTRAVAPLLEKLESKGDMLSRVIEALGNFGDVRIVKPLLKILEDRSLRPYHNVTAAALAKTADMRILEPIIAAVVDGRVEFRVAAEGLLKFDTIREARGNSRLYGQRSIDRLVHSLEFAAPAIRATALQQMKDFGSF